MVNVCVNVKYQFRLESLEKGYMWNPNTCNSEFDKTCEVAESLDLKACVCKAYVIDDFALTCEYKILDTTLLWYQRSLIYLQFCY